LGRVAGSAYTVHLYPKPTAALTPLYPKCTVGRGKPVAAELERGRESLEEGQRSMQPRRVTESSVRRGPTRYGAAAAKPAPTGAQAPHLHGPVHGGGVRHHEVVAEVHEPAAEHQHLGIKGGQVLKLLTCTDQSMAAVSSTTRSLQKSMNQPPNTSILLPAAVEVWYARGLGSCPVTRGTDQVYLSAPGSVAAPSQSLQPTGNGNTIHNFSTHGQQSEAQPCLTLE
jgi:hypothetical protein